MDIQDSTAFWSGYYYSVYSTAHQEMGQLVYLFIVYNLSQTVIYTISSLAVQSLPTYMTRDSKLQTELYVWNNVGVGIISLLISVFTMKIVTLLGGTQRA